ncbi:hypothetical protein JMG10_02620 [Nostoc ellipsosporum NOK]|nr:hypothetical protein [Nostoc ellipsosporum NOK]
MPPAGVRPDYSTAYLNDIKAKRAANQDRAALHKKVTQYRYKGLNQVVAQNSPDGGTSKFWYDRLGRLAVSQNAEQALHNQYSYTKYDNLGRITEVGQKANTTAITQTISKEESTLTTWLNGASVTNQLTITVYDEKYNPLSPDPGIAAGIDQQNLRNRVSYSMVKSLSTDTWHQTATVTDAMATGFDPAKTKIQRRGEKFFELSNHLGNVLARRIRSSGGNLRYGY